MCFSPSSITDWVACWSTGCWAIPVWQESPSIGGLAKEILEGESCGYHVTHHVKLRQICACVVRLKWLLMPMLWTLWYTCDCHVILLYIVCYGSACCGAPSFFSLLQSGFALRYMRRKEIAADETMPNRTAQPFVLTPPLAS